jgi:CHAT domain-containing protein
MAVSLGKGLYPDSPGSHQVFLNTRQDPSNPWQLPRPEAVVVVGLGEEGKLAATDLVKTVRQAVMAWAQRLAEKDAKAPPLFELAATLIGSGGAGIGVGQSAQLIVQGVREANEKLEERRRKDDQPSAGRTWPRVSHLYLVELYLDRATEAWRAVRLQAMASARQYVVTDVVQSAPGALIRPPESGYRGADYDFIRAETKTASQGQAIAYTLDTRRARTEVRAQSTQGALLKDLVERASTNANRDAQIGRTLFQLLVPIEMEPYLTGTTDMQIEVDGGTAGIPWELLDATTAGSGDRRPWAIRTKLLRKLRTSEFRAQVSDADAGASVLVIGEPDCDNTVYPRLYGAQEEARAVAAALVTGPQALEADRVRALVSDDSAKYRPDAREVINALLEREWRIVHIAGHGEAPQTDGGPRGVVLSNGVFLGPSEINSMRTVPELVFVNCCHLAARSSGQLLTEDQLKCVDRYNGARARFAAGVAEALIDVGVRCVIAAGWAVDDLPAKTFAQKFYESVLSGSRFIEAVAVAREAALDFGGNTWAAYQCYGDPDWTFRREVADAQRPTPPVERYAGVASARGLILALDTLAVELKFQAPRDKDAKDKMLEDCRGRIRHLESRFSALWPENGAVAEAFGAAWAAADEPKLAMTWYKAALAANDGSVSMRATEQRANLEVRVAWGAVEKAQNLRDARRRAAQTSSTGEPGDALRDARLEADGAQQALEHAALDAESDIRRGIDLLEKLVALEPSMERESLLASAYKRLAMVAAIAGRAADEDAAIARMKEHYETAEKCGRTNGIPGFYYPALNRVAAELIMRPNRGLPVQLDPAALADIREDLAAKVRDDPDFWSVVSQTELLMYEALARQDLAEHISTIAAAYDDLHGRVSQTWLWKSVYDQARFVLPKYMEHASSEEQTAGSWLMKRLASLAGLEAGDGAAVSG